MTMKQLSKKNDTAASEIRIDRELDLDALLRPASAFAHPMDVVRDPDLTLNEKRAILAAWASDVCSVESAPELRFTTTGNLVRWDDIMDALRTLDREGGKPLPHYKRVLAQKDASLLRTPIRLRSSGSQGHAVNQSESQRRL
jgi:hypothetical protein